MTGNSAKYEGLRKEKSPEGTTQMPSISRREHYSTMNSSRLADTAYVKDGRSQAFGESGRKLIREYANFPKTTKNKMSIGIMTKYGLGKSKEVETVTNTKAK